MIDVMRAAEGYLAERGVDAPRRSVELLMGRVLGLDRLQLYLTHDRPLVEAEKVQLRELVARRGKHEPVAYLLGDQEFYGHTLEVTPAVLIPRPETEGLVERVVRDAPKAARIADLGTGSGAIAVAIAIERDDVEVWGVDASAEALDVARRNVAKHRLEDRVRFALGSYWEAFDEGEQFDVLVSNPPYIDPDRPELLADDVRRFEPKAALFTRAGDPASEYRAILADARRWLRDDAVVWFEVGVGASDAALACARELDWLGDVELEDDLAGIPRYLGCRVRSGA